MEYQNPQNTPDGGKKEARPARLWRLWHRNVPWYAVAAAFCAILLMGWVLADRYDQGIHRLRVELEEASDLVFQKERDLLRLAEQVRLAQTDQFIASEARTKYDYLFPGEIRFVVTNPEVLRLTSEGNAITEGVDQP